ncbi:MAG: YtxH domain-containing protein [Dehalococcoidia bacterium]|nr:YtxH domain-containing protein [Dehalococcoidia bacterium]
MNSNDRLTIFGLAAGLVAGLALGLMYAPQPGAKTRSKLADRVNWLLWTPEEKYLYLWGRTRQARPRAGRGA